MIYLFMILPGLERVDDKYEDNFVNHFFESFRGCPF